MILGIILVTIILTSVVWWMVVRSVKRSERMKHVCFALNLPMQDFRDREGYEDKVDDIRDFLRKTKEFDEIYWNSDLPDCCVRYTTIGLLPPPEQLADFIKTANLLGRNVALVNSTTGDIEVIV